MDLGSRGAVPVIMRATRDQRRAVLVGRDKQIADVAHELRDAPHAADRGPGLPRARSAAANSLRALGSLVDLEGVLARASTR